MQYISKKTKLGVAVQEAIKELGLEREQEKIMSIFQKAFSEKYQAFRLNHSSNTVIVKGGYFTENQFPIGDNDRQQYFRAMTYQTKINNQLCQVNFAGQIRPFALIEGYSINEDPKRMKATDRRQPSKNSHTFKESKPRKIIKRN